MGLLTVGDPLDWDETSKVVDQVKEHGIRQFINMYHNLKYRHGDCLKFGDEIEYLIVKMDHQNKKARVSCRGEEILETLMSSEDTVDPSKNEFLWRPEYASYMLEGTPGMPYGGFLSCFNKVEDQMRRRRMEASRLLAPDEVLLTIPNFPRLGCSQFTDPPYVVDASQPISQSQFFPDQAIYSAHPRFKNLTRNIRQRRGSKVAINVPIFKDINTPDPFMEPGLNEASASAAKLNHIHMDHMGFGMGCCCLQVTFQAVNVGEARWLYDQLTPLTPILLALSAATPVFKGYLADVDSRWNIISRSVDDRTEEERGLKPLKNNKFVLNKSRYDTTDCYIYHCSAHLNDVPIQYEQKYVDELEKGEIDHDLAVHVAHMFTRDPLQVFRERIDQNDATSSEHFETIQSSNWMNMRFKPPPIDAPHIGWRVEFRPTEVQLTDFENAAYTCFVVLMTRVIISFRLTFLIPISQVDENMELAQKRDAVLNEKFMFRKGVVTCNSPPDVKNQSCCNPPVSDNLQPMTVDHIINGKEGEFPGLVPLCRQYLDSADVDVDTRCTIGQYLTFIQKRATGEIWTLAHWMRQFIAGHPLYKQDSVVSEELQYEMLNTMNNITNGTAHCDKLLGKFSTKSMPDISPAVKKGEMKKDHKKIKKNVTNGVAEDKI